MSGKRSGARGFKRPLSVRTKTIKVRKGQSSSVNPSKRKFRNEAKSQVFGAFPLKDQGGGRLTAENLQQHNGCAYESDAGDKLGIAETESNYSAESDCSLGSVMTKNRQVEQLLGLLTSCLKSLDLATWSQSSTLQVFSFMFPYIIHIRPKLRKLAQKLICSILMSSSIMLAPDAPPTHPVVPALSSFCLPIIKSSAGAHHLI
ncbi:hypothetical protein HPB51_008170 [Rhipicephalus microplus]|uniref:Uncharacterized protein n=1 Tax=Rhipicephalus microplus TaxID=6941 RepID=A0A9J6D8Y3_RHIMP|nr:hypothetical protein HPB51_008170 [Rhipicephalus microplus]